MIGCRQIRQRIAAKNGRFARSDEQPQNHKLTCQEDRKRLPIDWPQNEGSYAIAFLIDIRDSHLSSRQVNLWFCGCSSDRANRPLQRSAEPRDSGWDAE